MKAIKQDVFTSVFQWECPTQHVVWVGPGEIAVLVWSEDAKEIRDLLPVCNRTKGWPWKVWAHMGVGWPESGYALWVCEGCARKWGVLW